MTAHLLAAVLIPNESDKNAYEKTFFSPSMMEHSTVIIGMPATPRFLHI